MFLHDAFKGELCCTIENVISKAQDSNYPLPLQANRLCELAKTMSTRTKTLFLHNQYDTKNSWIVLDIDAMLLKIGQFFAPDSIREQVFTPSPTGILRMSELKDHFPELDPHMLVAFLRRLNFCQFVPHPRPTSKAPFESDEDIQSDKPILLCTVDPDEFQKFQIERDGRQEIKRLSPTHSTGSGQTDPLLYLPGLITTDKPSIELWIPDESYTFHTGWCLECVFDEHIFEQQFMATLSLLLEKCFVVKRECVNWKNGIRWLSLDGIETIVELFENGKAIVLLMRVKDGLKSLMKGLYLRSAVIHKILEMKDTYYPHILTSECLIDKSHLKNSQGHPVIKEPLRNLMRYKIDLILKAFLAKGMFFVFTKITCTLKFDDSLYLFQVSLCGILCSTSRSY